MSLGVKIIDVFWTKEVNVAVMRCGYCHVDWPHRLDRWKVICPRCKRIWNVGHVREQFAIDCNLGRR